MSLSVAFCGLVNRVLIFLGIDERATIKTEETIILPREFLFNTSNENVCFASHLQGLGFESYL